MKTIKLGSIGDPLSELNVQRRLQFLWEWSGGGVVYIPESWVKEDPAFQRAVEELDWLTVEQPE